MEASGFAEGDSLGRRPTGRPLECFSSGILHDLVGVMQMFEQPNGIGGRCPAGAETVVKSKTAAIHMVAEMEVLIESRKAVHEFNVVSGGDDNRIIFA